MVVASRSENPEVGRRSPHAPTVVVGIAPGANVAGPTGESPSLIVAGQQLLEQGLGFRLGRITRILRAQWTGQVAQLDLSPPQVAVLRGVAGRRGCSLRALARTLGADPMTIKRCIDELEGRGLVQSAHRGSDRKSRALELTAAGLTLAVRIDSLVREQERHLNTVLGPARRSRLEEALAVLEADLGLPAVSASPQTEEQP